MRKEKVLKVVKICIPILLILIAAIITISINLAADVYPAKYYSDNGYIEFSSNNTYETEDNVGLYRYDDDTDIVILDETVELERQSIFVLIGSDGTKYISAAAITWQVIGGLFYIAACVYMIVVYKVK